MVVLSHLQHIQNQLHGKMKVDISELQSVNGLDDFYPLLAVELLVALDDYRWATCSK